MYGYIGFIILGTPPAFRLYRIKDSPAHDQQTFFAECGSTHSQLTPDTNEDTDGSKTTQISL
jgi:hypothetical protein